MPADPLTLAYLGDPNSVHVRRWAAFFAGRGHRVCLLVPEEITVLPGLHAAIEVHRFRALPPRLSVPEILRARVDLARLTRRIGPSVVHAHYARTPAWHAWLAGHRPYVITVWGSDVLVTERMTRLGRLATGAALRGASLVTAASDRLAAAARELGARPARLRRVQFGVDLDRFGPGEPGGNGLRERLGVGDAPLVLSPRGLAPVYRHEIVVEAFAALAVPDAVLVITALNEDRAYRAQIEALAARLGIRERTHIIPPVDDDGMPDLYRAADVVVSVPRSDGVPVTLLEAMASGVPVVVSDLPGVREWVADLDGELLVPVGDARATGAAIARVLGLAPAARADLGQRLRARVGERASRARNMRQMEEWYAALAGAGRP